MRTSSARRAALVAVWSLSATALSASGEGATKVAESPKTHKIHEKISVSAGIDWIAEGPIGAAASVARPDERAATVSSVAELLEQLPGVSLNGQAGLFQVVSIRGVSRQRVASLISGMRISSERRAGVSTSFLDPRLLERVEVLRGPSTSFYGSGALGGAVQVVPRDFRGAAAEVGYDSVGDESFQAAGFGDKTWSAGLAHRRAGDARSADGTRLFSRFEQYSGIAHRVWEAGPRSYEVLGIVTHGEDIGKANIDFPTRTTTYPTERHQLVKFAVAGPAAGNAMVYVHAQDLETDVVDLQDGVRNVVRNESLDLGVRWDRETPLREGSFVRYGIEHYGRRGVEAEEVERDLATGTAGPPERTLDGAHLDEIGAFAVLRRHAGNVRWEGGGRLSWSGLGDGRGRDETFSAANGFVGVSWALPRGFRLGGRIDSGLRFPGLSELFFSGTTGAGAVVGNPDLDAERSLNGEISLQRAGKRLLWNASLFRNEITDYIERQRVDPADPALRTFRNLTSGTLQGVEVGGLFSIRPAWKLSWSAHAIHGRDSAGARLADVPADRLQLGLDWGRDPWGVRAEWTLRDAKRDPGAGEVELGSASIVSLRAGYRFSPSWRVDLRGTNLLDEKYTASADDLAPAAPGASVALHVAWNGG